MKQMNLPQMLLIAGTGRNTGKTSFVCSAIKKFCESNSIVAVKISPHFHENSPQVKILFNEDEVYIQEELNTDTGKDSSLMLAAGAKKSFYIVAADEYLEFAFNKFLTVVPENVCIICESGGLRKYVVPGLFLIFSRSDIKSSKKGIELLKPLADMWINSNEIDINHLIDTLEINNNCWKLKS
jgi:hypothetical protein